ncbi:MAG: hypothetical protein OHK0039_45790 [Bacteroidia bacterium]
MLCLWGQQADPPPLQIGLGLAGYAYTGDLTYGETDFVRAYPGGNISVQFDGSKALQIQLNAGYGRFVEQLDGPAADPVDGIAPNTFVETSFFYTDLRLRLRFFRAYPLQPYLSAGMGMLFFTPRDAQGNFLGENIFTRYLDETYGTTVPVFPLTVGLRYRFNALLQLGAGYTYRVVQTDYLDNIGRLGQQPGNDALHAAEIALYIRLGGNAAPRDPVLPDPPVDPWLSLLARERMWIDFWESYAPPALLPDAGAVEQIRYTPAD